MAKNQFNWPLVGNKHITELLEREVKNNMAGGAYIFTGPDNLGKTTLAVYFAQCLLCQKDNSPCGECQTCQRFKKYSDKEEQNEYFHSDFYLIKRDKSAEGFKKNISIEQIRDLIKSLQLSSFLNSYKISIIKHAETLSPEASNALLKTLEEPRKNVVIILITQDKNALLPTIVSRAKILNFKPVKTELIYENLTDKKKIARGQAKKIANLSLGRPALAAKFLEDEEFYKHYFKKADTFYNFFSQDINQRFKSIENLFEEKKVTQKSSRLVKRTLEVWQGIARDFMLLSLGHNDLLQHQIPKEITARISKYPILKIILIINSLKEAKENLDANVNPKLVLENIALNI